MRLFRSTPMLAATALLAPAWLVAPATAQAPGQPGQYAAPGQPATPPGFALTDIEQAYLDRVLAQWEERSGAISTFSCPFTRLVYDPVFGPGADLHKNEERGSVSYQKPDKGSFRIDDVKQWDAKAQRHVDNPAAAKEHWVCDGEAVYEYKHDQKQLVVRPIPPEFQGQNIAEGPLPFLFGAEADKLKARYWMRVDARAPEGTVWLVASPKRRSDAANYRQVDLMLDAREMLPNAMRVTMPDGSHTTYTFELADASINSRVTQLWNRVFQAPMTPIGWKRVVEQPETAQAAAPPRR